MDQWRGNILTSADAAGLSNAGQLSLFVMMTCLNGYFQDAALDSLAESLLKRDAGVKDSGQIPGLGGILDVLDSLLFTVPFVYFYLTHLVLRS